MDVNMNDRTVTLQHEGGKVVHKYEADATFNGERWDVEATFVEVTVLPEEGNFPAVARGLLAAADHPNQVKSVSHPHAGFIVPQYVFDRFAETFGPDADSDADADEPKALKETPKRRGRPRKDANADKEE